MTAPMRTYQRTLTREASLFRSRILRQMRLRHPKAKGTSEHVNENVLYRHRAEGLGAFPCQGTCLPPRPRYSETFGSFRLELVLSDVHLILVARPLTLEVRFSTPTIAVCTAPSFCQ